MAQQVKVLLVTLASPSRVSVTVLAALVRIQLLANALEKAVEDGSSGSLCHPRGNPGRSSWLLAFSWPSPGG